MAQLHLQQGRLDEAAACYQRAVRLNPDDYAAVMSHRGEGWAGSHVTVLPDAAVARGGCLVESDFGLVDGSIDAQLQELGRAMLGEQEALVAVPRGE